MINTILAANSPSNCTAGTGPFGDGGHNIDFPNSVCPGSNLNPRLGPLKDNGGPAFTRALGAGSPARDAVPATGGGCPRTDERGVHRPQGPWCDIGGFELATPVIALTSPRGGARYGRGQHVHATFRCSEGGITSTIRSCVGTVRDHHMVDTSKPGTHSFTVSATDKVGAHVTKTVHYTVK